MNTEKCTITGEKALHWEKGIAWQVMKMWEMKGDSKQKMDSDGMQEDRPYKQGWGAQKETIKYSNSSDHKN